MKVLFCEELVAKLSAGEDIVVIDVRSERDYEICHIKGAINIPIHKLMNELYIRVKQFEERDCILFHCEFSQQRGPKAAKSFKRAAADSYTHEQLQNISVLYGGISEFLFTYGNSEWIVRDENIQ